MKNFLSEELIQDEKKQRSEQEINEFKGILGGLLPWYIARAQILLNDFNNISEIVKLANEKSSDALKNRWQEFDFIPSEIAQVRISILIFSRKVETGQIKDFVTKYFGVENEIWLPDRLSAVRSAYRLDHLTCIRNELEEVAYQIVASSLDETSETQAKLVH